LNPRPSDYKSDALPTELRQQNLCPRQPAIGALPDNWDKNQRLAHRLSCVQPHLPGIFQEGLPIR